MIRPKERILKPACLPVRKRLGTQERREPKQINAGPTAEERSLSSKHSLFRDNGELTVAQCAENDVCRATEGQGARV